MVVLAIMTVKAFKVPNKLVYALEENDKAPLQSRIRENYSEYPMFCVSSDTDVTSFSIKTSRIIYSNLIQCTVNGSGLSRNTEFVAKFRPLHRKVTRYPIATSFKNLSITCPFNSSDRPFSSY